MKIKNIFIGLTTFAMAVGAASCTGAYIDINKDPYGVTDSEMDRDGYNVKAALVGMMSGVISTDVNTAQFTDCLLGGPCGGYFTISLCAVPSDIFTMFTPRSGSVSRRPSIE